MGKLAPEGSSDLRNFLGTAESVEPRHQGGLQSRRDRHSGRRNGCNGTLGRALAFRFQYRLRHLLNKQRNAVGALDDFLPNAGRSLLPATRSIIASTSRRLSRLRVRAVTCGCPIQGGSNSGRKVTINSTRRVATLSTARPNASKLVGSAQCTSSKIISTGPLRANVSTCAWSASSVFCRRCCGVTSSAG